MRDKPVPPKPRRRSDAGPRAERLAEALRANLARRKAQKRAREAAGQGDKDKG
jgi:hypothetical protein